MQQAETAGLDGFLIKPVSPSVMFDTIMQTFGKDAPGVLRPIAEKNQSAQARKELGGTRVLLVEDHPLMRSAVVSLLERQFGEVAATFAGTGKEVQALKGRWDLILLDHHLPDVRGLDLLPGLGALGPVLVLTTYADAGLTDLARERGARGYVAKGDDPALLLDVVKDVLAGGSSFHVSEDPDSTPKFSRQERRVLEGLLQGESAVKLAEALSVAPTTIQSYKDRLFSKLGVANTAELVRKAISKGWD